MCAVSLSALLCLQPLSLWPVLHIPSLAANFGITLPVRKQIRTAGGRQKGDIVKVEPNSTLRFFAEEVSSDDSDSDSAGQADAGEPVSPEQVTQEVLVTALAYVPDACTQNFMHRPCNAVQR